MKSVEDHVREILARAGVKKKLTEAQLFDASSYVAELIHAAEKVEAKSGPLA